MKMGDFYDAIIRLNELDDEIKEQTLVCERKLSAERMKQEMDTLADLQRTRRELRDEDITIKLPISLG